MARKIDYSMIRLIDEVVPEVHSSSIRHCKPEECIQYGHHFGYKGMVCKRQAHNPRNVEYGKECLDSLPPR